MRTREQIMEERSRCIQNSTQASYWYTKQSATQEAILEVLLDIRDILSTTKSVVSKETIEGVPV